VGKSSEWEELFPFGLSGKYWDKQEQPMSQISAFLSKIHGFLSGLNIPGYVFLALFVVIIIWLFITRKKVKRAVGIPFKVIDKQFKKKLEELDREKAELKELVAKEVKKVSKSQKKLEAQVEEEIQAMRELRVEKEIQMKQEAEEKEEIRTKARIREKEKIRAEKEPEKEEIKIEKEEPAEPPAPAVEEARVEPEPPVKEVQVEKDMEPEKKVEKVEKVEIEVERMPEEEKVAVEKPPKKDAEAKLTSEQTYLLSAIGDEPDKTLQEDALFKIYQLAYPDLKKEDFDHQIKKLEKLGFVKLEKPSGYRVWIKITDEGLEHYRGGAEE